MGKERNAQKANKKESTKTLKQRRAEKKAKRANRE
jgi:hypothetical protein